MYNVKCKILEHDKEIEFSGNRLLEKFLFMEGGDPIFITDSSQEDKKEGILLIYSPSEKRVFTRGGGDPLSKYGTYGVRFEPKAFAKISFGAYPFHEETMDSVFLKLEMTEGIFGFKGYKPVKKLLTRGPIIKTTIKEVSPLKEKFFFEAKDYTAYLGRVNSLFGLNSCLEEAILSSRG